jgi:hypothetical protein
MCVWSTDGDGEVEEGLLYRKRSMWFKIKEKTPKTQNQKK